MHLLQSLFSIAPIYLIYFFYGMTFFFLGAFIVAKNMEASNLKLAGKLWLLGAFGFAHGLHEWLKLYPLIEGENLSREDLFAAQAIAVSVGALSFIFLLLFGYSLVRAVSRRILWVRLVPASMFVLWAGYLWQYGDRPDFQFLRQVELGMRYTIGLSGSMLSAYGLIIYSSEVRSLSHSISNKIFAAGVAFIFYGVFVGLFPSNVLVPVILIPVEVMRGLSSIVITYFIIRALNIFDVETRKKIEEQTRLIAQTEKLSSLGLLATGVAHEINNPLTNASLGIQMLKSTMMKAGSEGDAVERLAAVERNIDRASTIAQELLHFSRRSSAGLIPVNVNDIVQSSIALVRFRMKDIVVDMDLRETPAIMGDPAKLEQVIINILSNALEAMPTGGRLAIVTMQQDATVLIKISDTGSGISVNNLSRVFDPFFTTKEIGKGTGLGLSISYGIIKQHRGSISIASDEGKGTAITIALPTKERYEEDTDH